MVDNYIVIDKKTGFNYRYYQLCVLWELSSALKAGDIWINNSRRYTTPESYLIPKERWLEMRSEACQILQLPKNAIEKLLAYQQELKALLEQMDKNLPNDSGVRVEAKELVVPRIKAEEESSSVNQLEALVLSRLPRVELTDLLIEVDHWINFTKHLEHAGGNEPASEQTPVYLL